MSGLMAPDEPINDDDLWAVRASVRELRNLAPWLGEQEMALRLAVGAVR